MQHEPFKTPAHISHQLVLTSCNMFRSVTYILVLRYICRPKFCYLNHDTASWHTWHEYLKICTIKKRLIRLHCCSDCWFLLYYLYYLSLLSKLAANVFTGNTDVRLGVVDVDGIWILPIILLFPVFKLCKWMTKLQSSLYLLHISCGSNPSEWWSIKFSLRDTVGDVCIRVTCQ